MLMHESMELIKKYGGCPECGNDKVGGEPSQGALIIEDEVFTRSCKCGWKLVVDRRIKHQAMMTKKRGSKLVGGCYEVSIHGLGRKLLPLLELKEKAGVTRINQHAKIEDWLNSGEGRKWALEVPAESVY
ncbi:MAG TPA: DUF3797 domain-containing protein [Sporosarcina psychrophila]|uniref:DUF3797 domain-containing protein n=1 Tax=Sporosarcina psychrophila TaxID=1476 RepID=A0A921KDL5_SPOPS|nr:DUF3797 domain-containing protein [Sporosarcina psychrophila]